MFKMNYPMGKNLIRSKDLHSNYPINLIQNYNTFKKILKIEILSLTRTNF